MTALHSWIDRLAGQHVIVVGDVILDEYLTGRAVRMSREAPVPVLEFESRSLIAGGAANPSATIAALGSFAQQIGIVGADSEGAALCNILAERGIASEGVLTDPNRPTTLKTRILAHMGLRFPQQVARMDRLSRQPVGDELETALCTHLTTTAAGAQAVLCSDYQGGLLTGRVVAAALDAGRLTTADAQGSLSKYAGFSIVKCNADEAAEAVRRPLHTDADFAGAAHTLCADLRLTRGMVITRGAEGATLAEPGLPAIHCPAPAITDVYDTVGAGDTAIAVITLATCAGASLTEAVMLANYASGIVVRRVGNYAPTLADLRAALAGA